MNEKIKVMVVGKGSWFEKSLADELPNGMYDISTVQSVEELQEEQLDHTMTVFITANLELARQLAYKDASSLVFFLDTLNRDLAGSPENVVERNFLSFSAKDDLDPVNLRDKLRQLASTPPQAELEALNSAQEARKNAKQPLAETV